MAWINYTSGSEAAGTARLAAFEEAYPNAVVVVSENDVSRCALDHRTSGFFVKIDAVEHLKVKEYRALTLATAEYLKAGVAGNGKLPLWFSYSDSSFSITKLVCAAIVGTERQCSISRANEADGYTLTVTESTTNWDPSETIPPTASHVSYGGTGSVIGVVQKGDVYIDYGANS